MSDVHSVKTTSYTVKTDYGTFHICYGCKVLGHCPPAKGSAGYVGHPLHDARGCQCEHESHFDGSEEETFSQAVEGALNAAARRLGAE